MTISQHTKTRSSSAVKNTNPSEISSTNFSFAGCRYSLSRELRAHNYANALGKIHFIIAPSFVSFLSLVLISILFRRVLKTASGAVRKCGGRMQISVSPRNWRKSRQHIWIWTLSKPQAMSSMSSSQTNQRKYVVSPSLPKPTSAVHPSLALHF